jgi:hypothetical protein
MGNLNGRIERLEGRIPPPKDKGAELRRAVMRDIMDEFARLKSLRGHGIHRTGEPNIPPFDPAGEHLGYPYTTGELLEFAVRRVFEHEREIAPEILSAEATEQMAARWTEALRKQSFFGSRWNEVQAEGPPEPMRPWRGGGF